MVKTKNVLKNIKKIKNKKEKIKKTLLQKRIKGGSQSENKSNNGMFSWFADLLDAISNIFHNQIDFKKTVAKIKL